MGKQRIKVDANAVKAAVTRHLRASLDNDFDTTGNNPKYNITKERTMSNLPPQTFFVGIITTSMEDVLVVGDKGRFRVYLEVRYYPKNVLDEGGEVNQELDEFGYYLLETLHYIPLPIYKLGDVITTQLIKVNDFEYGKTDGVLVSTFSIAVTFTKGIEVDYLKDLELGIKVKEGGL